MRQGCALGCFVVLLLAAAGGFGVYTLANGAGLFEDYPRRDTAGLLPGEPAVLVRVDMQHASARPLLESILGDAAGGLAPFVLDSLPHEGSWTIDPEPESGKARMQVALSLRRLSGMLASRADSEAWRWFPGQRVESIGLEEPGLWLARSQMPLNADALDLAAQWSVADTPRPELPGGGVAAMLIDNRRGQGYLALEPLLNPARQPGEPEPPQPGPDARDWAAWCGRLSTATALLRLETDGVAVAELVLEAPNAAASGGLLALAEHARDRVAAAIEAGGGWLDGQWTRDGTQVRGTFTVREGQRLLRNRLLRVAI